MTEPLTTLFIPGLLCTPKLYADQIPAVWRLGPIAVADHTRDDSMEAIARRILSTAPPSFAIVGLSMGGYLSFELMRQAPGRVRKLALLDTAASPDTPVQTAQRLAQIELTERGEFSQIPGLWFTRLVHPSRHGDEALRQSHRLMVEATGAQAFVRQQRAIMSRPDSRPGLGAITCPTLVIVGDGDVITPPERAAEIVAGIPGAKMIVIPECGHLSTVEHPDVVTRLLVDFLAGS